MYLPELTKAHKLIEASESIGKDSLLIPRKSRFCVVCCQARCEMASLHYNALLIRGGDIVWASHFYKYLRVQGRKE